jgi:hypothetical protein
MVSELAAINNTVLIVVIMGQAKQYHENDLPASEKRLPIW